MNMKKAGLLSLALWANLFASSLTVTSDITANTSWNTDTVLVNKTGFTVFGGVRLTIMPGTVVIFQKSLRFITVRGTITAAGAVDDSIRFLQEDSRILWQGIRLLKRPQGYSGMDSSFLRYCVLEGAQCVETDSLYMKRGSLVYCGPGNYVEITNSVLLKSHGYHGGAVYVDSGAATRIENCRFSGNTADFYGGGGIMTNEKGTKKLLVQNCRFENNFARTGGAVWIGNGTTAEFNTCVFYRDTTLAINPTLGDLRGGAIAVFGPSDITLRNSILFYCKSYEKGGAIYSADASMKLINCTLANNVSVRGGGIYFAKTTAATSPLLVNTIEGGNGTSSRLPRDSAGCGIFLDSSVNPVFRYCQLYDTVHDVTIKPYSGEFTGSRYYRTDFLGSTPGFNLSDTVVEGYQLYSRFNKYDPAINGGTPDSTGLGLPEFDVLGQPRIKNGVVDIGAIEFQVQVGVRYSSPIRKQPLTLGVPYDVIIYTLDGRTLRTFRHKVIPGSIGMFVEALVPKGIYLVSMNCPGRQSRFEKVLVK